MIMPTNLSEVRFRIFTKGILWGGEELELSSHLFYKLNFYPGNARGGYPYQRDTPL